VLTRRGCQWLRRHGIALECSDTPNAVATFNVLAQEGRRVAGAFLPIGDALDRAEDVAWPDSTTVEGTTGRVYLDVER
jgi:hypothetical protein